MRIITIKKLLYNVLYLGISDKLNFHKLMDKEISIFDLFKEFYKQKYVILITIIIVIIQSRACDNPANTQVEQMSS